MKTVFKKIALLGALFLGILGSVAAAPMNSKFGYLDLAWGCTLAQIKMKGYELAPMDADVVASEQSDFKEKIAIYTLANKKDKFVINAAFYFCDGKLFKVMEVLDKTMANPAKLAIRYGKFAAQGIKQIGDDKNAYADFTFSKDGFVDGGSIGIQIAGDSVDVALFDFSTFSKINRQMLQLSGKATIADMFYELADDLLKNTAKDKKISMAFVALTSDAQNKLVENYVTDALTQAVFEGGNVRIIERANLEKILKEQKFQSSGLVDDNSAKAIGKIAGVDYVCYGDMKDIGEEITVNARIVDVESGEVLAISRTTVEKDKYLRDYAVAQKKIEQEKIEKVQQEQKAKAERVAKAKWEVTKNRNEFDEYTTYTFICRTTTGQFLFVGYDKYDNSMYSVVRAGIKWSGDPDYVRANDYGGNGGEFELKGDDGSIYKTLKFGEYNSGKWALKTGWKTQNSYDIRFTYDEKQNIKDIINIFGSNNVLAVRCSRYDYVKRFETAMFWEVLAAQGITKEELFKAIDNEKF